MRYVLVILIGMLCLLATSCDQASSNHQSDPEETVSSPDSTPGKSPPGKELNLESVLAQPDTSPLERTILSQGLVNIKSVAPEVRLDMKYSTEDNFLKADVYGEFADCYLQKEVAEMLAMAKAYYGEA